MTKGLSESNIEWMKSLRSHMIEQLPTINKGLTSHEIEACLRGTSTSEVFVISPFGVSLEDSVYAPGVRWFFLTRHSESEPHVYIEFGLYSRGNKKLVANQCLWSEGVRYLGGKRCVKDLDFEQPDKVVCFLLECQPFFDAVCRAGRHAPALPRA